MSAKILIADDSRMIRLIVRANLEGAGYEVLEAEDGDQALERASDELPDLILLDVVMPGRGGFEVLRRLKESRSTGGIPVIMLTSERSEDSQIEGWQSGAEDYLTKPFNPAALVAIVRKHLSGRPVPGVGRRDQKLEKLHVLKELRRMNAGSGASDRR